MNDKTLVSGNLGTVGSYEVDFQDGQLIAKESVAVDGVSESAQIAISGKAVLDGIAKKIGGPIPAEVALFLEASLGLK